MKIFVFLPCALLALAGPAAAQDSGQDAPSAPCQAQPQDDGQQPPPDQGKTPVIKPGEVPAQPPKQ